MGRLYRQCPLAGLEIGPGHPLVSRGRSPGGEVSGVRCEVSGAGVTRRRGRHCSLVERCKGPSKGPLLWGGLEGCRPATGGQYPQWRGFVWKITKTRTKKRGGRSSGSKRMRKTRQKPALYHENRVPGPLPSVPSFRSGFPLQARAPRGTASSPGSASNDIPTRSASEGLRAGPRWRFGLVCSRQENSTNRHLPFGLRPDRLQAAAVLPC
jgi:hypothetical protein